MKNAHTVDTARLGILLNELRLPAIKTLWPQFTEQADKEGWPAARFLTAIAEHELAERDRRRIARHLAEARLPPGKTLDSFAFDAVPMISKAQVMAIAAGDGWLAEGANILMFGPPGGGKSHLAAAIGLALIENGWRVLFTRTTDLVQKLQIARRELQLESVINKLDKFDLLILDDLAYVTKDQAETSVLFELISARYERKSILITANQPFGEWNKVFPDPAMTLAAVDRLVHHATIFEMNVESYRRRSAMEAKRKRGRPASYATIKGQITACQRQANSYSQKHRDTRFSSRLSRRTGDIFDTPIGKRRTHPADDARLRLILIGMQRRGFTDQAAEVSVRWEALVDALKAHRPPEYLRCYPEDLLKLIVVQVQQSIEEMGVTLATPGALTSWPERLEEAWSAFWENPNGYTSWEKNALKLSIGVA